MEPTIWKNKDYSISTDKEKLDIKYIHRFLSGESYWAQHIPLHVVEKSIQNSLCFGLYYKEGQVGFARLITDEATFGYLADVFIDKDYRGQKLGKWLMQVIMEYPALQDLRRIMLATRDAQHLYKAFGFQFPVDNHELMYIRRPDIYKRDKGST
ncbi:MAG TPA: GNAT family N-acetyltransferase [Chitinophagaceae bacterium]|nr:GNAT family N-acetyltransferase [Chitinophagaceae bacterium]